MFNIGDKIVYPIYGAGVIESIEEKEVLGEKNKYYIMHILLNGMKLMIPLNNIDTLGIRSIIDKEQADKVLEILSEVPTEMNKVWTKRYRENESKLKGGNIFEIAEIVRNLIILDRLKKLSKGEKKILVNAKDMLVSEFMLIYDINSSQAEQILEGAVK